jgi:hypothetical protein
MAGQGDRTQIASRNVAGIWVPARGQLKNRSTVESRLSSLATRVVARCVHGRALIALKSKKAQVSKMKTASLALTSALGPGPCFCGCHQTKEEFGAASECSL